MSFTIVVTVEGRGVQIYRCQQQGEKYAWVLEGPEATLFTPGTTKQLGTHSLGPVWKWNDGSAIIGNVIGKSPSPNPNSIPGLLLETRPIGTSIGVLTVVSQVNRSATQGGNPPTNGCDAAHIDVKTRVPYTATYSFWRKL